MNVIRLKMSATSTAAVIQTAIRSSKTTGINMECASIAVIMFSFNRIQFRVEEKVSGHFVIFRTRYSRSTSTRNID